MTTRTVKLLGSDRSVLATAEVADEGLHYGGTVDLRGVPDDLRVLFEELEELVTGQMFSLVDGVQRRIAAIPVFAAFDGVAAVPVEDLQVFPSTGDISFRVRNVTAETPRVESVLHAGFPAESPAADHARR